MLVTFSGMFMLRRLVQPRNANSPILVMLSGNFMLLRLVQSENASLPLDVTVRIYHNQIAKSI